MKLREKDVRLLKKKIVSNHEIQREKAMERTTDGKVCFGSRIIYISFFESTIKASTVVKKERGRGDSKQNNNFQMFELEIRRSTDTTATLLSKEKSMDSLRLSTELFISIDELQR